jgi:hypothetical protein
MSSGVLGFQLRETATGPGPLRLADWNHNSWANVVGIVAGAKACDAGPYPFDAEDRENAAAILRRALAEAFREQLEDVGITFDVAMLATKARARGVPPADAYKPAGLSDYEERIARLVTAGLVVLDAYDKTPDADLVPLLFEWTNPPINNTPAGVLPKLAPNTIIPKNAPTRGKIRCACAATIDDLGEMPLKFAGWELVDGAWRCPRCNGKVKP